MANDFSYSDAGFALTKLFEGLRLTAYQDQGGVWTIGYGHTGPGVQAGLVITEAQADIFLQADVARAVTAVNLLVTAAISQGQFDALVDFAFNLGSSSLAHSTLLKQVNAGDFAGAAQSFLLWDHIGKKVNPGLLRRRTAEVAMFNGTATVSGGAPTS
jgi:lysozyme